MQMSENDLISGLADLVSEKQNPDTLDLDLMSTLELVTAINQQDIQVPQAVSKILPQLADSVDAIVSAIKGGGRLVYIGAGTSGRLGVLDAVECVPTFGVPEGLVIGLLAGGENAMFKAKEGIEDKQLCGVADLKSIDFCGADILVGIAASGRTPYVIGALEYANSQQAVTIALSSNPNAEIAKLAKISLLPVVGPEPITGSTRMKSGTMQKLVLNILSTASMVRLGKVYKNLMVDVKATNEKLYARATRMVMDITGVTCEDAETALKQANMQVKLAVLMLLANLDATEGRSRLDECDGNLREALARYQ